LVEDGKVLKELRLGTTAAGAAPTLTVGAGQQYSVMLQQRQMVLVQ
jgi:hypothetical protein